MSEQEADAKRLIVVERRAKTVIGQAASMDEARRVVDSWRAAREGWVDPRAYGSADIYQLAEAEHAPADDSAYQDPSELVIRVQGRLSEPEEVALALEKLAHRIRESGDVRSATGYDMAGGFRDTQGNAMGTTEVR